jgi:branched-chain amino acid transport system substrate-binding protein
MMKLSKHRMSLVAAAGALGLGLAACAAGGPGNSGPSGNAPVTIGISLSLSGDFSNTGKAGELGYQLWASQVNSTGGLLGHKVKLIIADDASSPNQAVTNYENFITRDGVTLVAGPYSSLLTLASAKVAERYGYAFVEGAGNGPSVFQACLPNLLLADPATSTAGGLVWARFILSLPPSQRPTTAAYPTLNDPFALPEASAIQQVFQAHGIRTVYKTIYPSETTDLTPVIEHLATMHPQMVVSGSQDADGWAQVKAMVQLRFSPKFLFMTNGPENPLDFPANVGRANTPGIFTSDVWTPTAGLPGNSQFVAAYIKKFGGNPQQIDSTSAETYSVGQMIQAAVEKARSFNNAKLIKILHQDTFTTLLGTIHDNKCGAPSGTQFLEEWIGGRLLIVYPSSVAQHAPVIPKPTWP